MTEGTTGLAPDLVRSAADRLLDATATRTPCPPVRDLIDADDVASAYAVQRQVVAARLASGAAVTGRKIGLTSKAVQSQLGVDQPDFGFLLSDMAYLGGDIVPARAVLQPRVEAEVAFVLGQDLIEGPLDNQQVRDAVAYAVAALEICGSRIVGWDITFADTVADNASAGAYVLGPMRRSLDDFEPREATMSMHIDGAEVSSGTGADCLGDPINALVWLAQKARDLGEPLKAGQVILSGALGPMRPIEPGSVVRAEISGLGSVTFSLGHEVNAHKEGQ